MRKVSKESRSCALPSPERGTGQGKRRLGMPPAGLPAVASPAGRLRRLKAEGLKNPLGACARPCWGRLAVRVCGRRGGLRQSGVRKSLAGTIPPFGTGLLRPNLSGQCPRGKGRVKLEKKDAFSISFFSSLKTVTRHGRGVCPNVAAWHGLPRYAPAKRQWDSKGPRPLVGPGQRPGLPEGVPRKGRRRHSSPYGVLQPSPGTASLYSSARRRSTRW